MAGETQLVLDGPTEVEPNTEAIYSGRLTGVDDDGLWKPLPQKGVVVIVDDVAQADVVTDADGRFSVALSFSPGDHIVKTRYHGDCVPEWAGAFPYPVGYWDNGFYISTGISAPRPTPSDLGMDFQTLSLPATSTVWRVANRMALYGTSYYLAWKENAVVGYLPTRYWVSRFGPRVSHFSITSPYQTYPAGIAVTRDAVWVVECQKSAISGQLPMYLTKADIVSGSVLSRTYFADGGIGRHGDIIALSTGGVVFCWYEAGAGIRMGFGYVGPDGTLVIGYPIDLAQTGTTQVMDVAMAEHPVDGSVWGIYHRDGEGTLGAFKLNLGATITVETRPDFVPSGDQYQVYEREGGWLAMVTDWTNLRLVGGYTCRPPGEPMPCIRDQSGEPSYWQRYAIMEIGLDWSRSTTLAGAYHDFRMPNALLVVGGKERVVGYLQQPETLKHLYLYGPDEYGWEPWTAPAYCGDEPSYGLSSLLLLSSFAPDGLALIASDGKTVSVGRSR